jgi:copper(I)-binding protein
MTMKKSLIAALLASAGLLAACGQPAPDAPAAAAPQAATETLALQDPAARATPDGAKVAAGYMTIVNSGAEADRVVAASSPRAARMELHEMAMEGDMMTMRPVAAIEIPAGGKAELKPGGLHFMFMEIDAPFKEGDSIPLSLTFEKAGVVETSLPVKTFTAKGDADEHAGH